ncbi:MAG: hypothetical protein OXT67_03300 [Zetaproteobacteria bacterium]|nr:hypothetical protein [Zetaproteobacteria bacterium]
MNMKSFFYLLTHPEHQAPSTRRLFMVIQSPQAPFPTPQLESAKKE